jgi:hypothetical protein
MKYIRNNEADGVFERLLRAEFGRTSGLGAPCAQFDPDLSAAYVERNLTPREVSRFEVHLAGCSNCRIQVARLARAGYQASLAEVEETAPSFERRYRGSDSIFSRISSYLLQPQWIAIATTALVVLIAVPVFVILKNAKSMQGPEGRNFAESREGPAAVEPESRPGPQQGDSVTSRTESDGTADLSRSGGVAGYFSDQRTTPPTSNPPSGTGQATAGVPAGEVGGLAAPAAARPSDAPAQKTDGGNRQLDADKPSEPGRLAQNQPQQTNQLPNRPRTFDQVTVTAGAAPIQEKQLQDQLPVSSAQRSSGQGGKTEDKEATAKKAEQASASEQISPKEAQTLPEDDSKKDKVSILRPGGGSVDAARTRDRGTIRPKDSEPPKIESTHDEAERRIAKGPAKDFATTGRSEAESVHKPAAQPLARSPKLERRVETKRFRMQAGIWTDRDFKPAKEIPVVTLVRESEIFKSALEKQPALRGFLAGFGVDDRVIVVYKGIVYKVVPPVVPSKD